MLYDSYAFSKNGKVTMQRKSNPSNLIVDNYDHKELSKLDIQQINKLTSATNDAEGRQKAKNGKKAKKGGKKGRRRLKSRRRKITRRVKCIKFIKILN